MKHTTKAYVQAQNRLRDAGQGTLTIVLIVLAIIALAIWIFSRVNVKGD